ncbi:sugar kinase [Streptomyces sp. NPDC092296]|uniref:sugar kinase n=1 Tax=Streptomyces sp. NPDC092296 TaxID=3366012 RepID=UPI00380D030E
MADGRPGGPPAAVCVGESMAVLVADRPGPLEHVPAFHRTVGGAESNVACGLAALGRPAAWISRVGADGLGRHLVAELAARGVDTSAVAVDPHRPTGLYLKEVGSGADDPYSGHPYDPGPGRSRPHYYRGGSAASALGPELLADPAAAALLAAAPLVHLSGITAALSDSCLALLRALLARPRPTGRTVSLDLNWRPALWHGRDPGVLPGLLDAADLVLLGADEAAEALGTADPAALRALLPHPATLVVKDAEHAATAVARDGGTVTEPALRVEVVEATGAGDAFAAGYLTALLRGLDRRRGLRLGHLCAAAALTVPGDHAPPPPPAAVDALLAASPADWAATRVTAAGIDSPALGPPNADNDPPGGAR